MDNGTLGLIAGIFSTIATGFGMWYATHSGNRSNAEATAVAWSRELRAELGELRLRVDKLEGKNKHFVGFVDDFGQWVTMGATPPPPFPPEAIREDIEMSHWQVYGSE